MCWRKYGPPTLSHRKQNWRSSIQMRRQSSYMDLRLAEQKKRTPKLKAFINKCLRRILNIRWTGSVTNETQWERRGQHQVKTQILQWKWRWIGHTFKACEKHYQTGIEMESQKQGKERMPQEHLSWGGGSRDEKMGPYLDHIRKACSR